MVTYAKIDYRPDGDVMSTERKIGKRHEGDSEFAACGEEPATQVRGMSPQRHHKRLDRKDWRTSHGGPPSRDVSEWPILAKGVTQTRAFVEKTCEIRDER